MQGLPSILFLFTNELYQFKNTGAQILDSIYHMTLKNYFDIMFCHGKAKFTKILNHKFMDFNAWRYITP